VLKLHQYAIKITTHAINVNRSTPLTKKHTTKPMAHYNININRPININCFQQSAAPNETGTINNCQLKSVGRNQ